MTSEIYLNSFKLTKKICTIWQKKSESNCVVLKKIALEHYTFVCNCALMILFNYNL